MRKLTSGILAVTFCFLAAVPASPQRMRAAEERESAIKLRTAFARVDAVSDGRAVIVEWETRSEIDSLGFNVYRLGQSRPVNVSLILGGAAKSNRVIQSGDRYQFFDVDGLDTDEYVVESVSANGRRVKSVVTRAREIDHTVEVDAANFQRLREQAVAFNGEAETVPASMGYRSIKEFVHQPNLETHRWVARQPGVKIGVNKAGLHRVSCDQLANAGFNVTSPAANWRLFRDGVEQAILTGNDDRCIEFFGKGIDTPESDTRVYFLINDSISGKRMRSLQPRGIVTKSVSSSYLATVEKKERISFVPSIINGEKENYWGSAVVNDPTTQSFTLSAIDFSSPDAEITVKIQGFRRISGQITNHVIAAKLNGNPLPNFGGANHEAFEGRFTISTALLKEGANSLELRSVNAGDFSLFDSVTVNHSRKYRADQNRLSVITPSAQRAVFSGFASADLRVFDISREGEPVLLSGLYVAADSDGYSVNVPAGRPIAAFGVEKSGLLAPLSVLPNETSDLANPVNQADLIIIHYGHPDFLTAAETWANYRRGEGFTVKIANINDVFDEFSFGVTSSQAINNFLNHAFTRWQVKPRYALLLGDATNDPRNYLNLGNFNFIPSRAVSLIYSESGSDEALADFNNDGLAEIAIGRIPARTSAALSTAFNKTILFETPAEQKFNRGALFAFDVPDGWNFQLSSQQLSEKLPAQMPRLNVPRGMLAPGNPFTIDPNAQTNLLNGLSAGKFIVNYAGHGTTGLWANAGYFNNAAAGQITNAGHPTIFTMLTCLNGYFLRPDADSISEVLLKSTGGGAVAAWASTADTTPDIQTVMGVRFYAALAENDSDRLGDLIKEAKKEIPAGLDVRLSWALLGDPMLKANDTP